MPATTRLLGSPDAWLLAQFDADPGAGNVDQRASWNERPIFDVIDDHPDDGCDEDECMLGWKARASWPDPRVGDEVNALDDLHDPDGWAQVGVA